MKTATGDSAPQPGAPDRHERSRQTIGFVLFAIYATAYSGFVIISVWDVELMDTLMPLGLNLAAFYGLGLIFLALLLALIYSRSCNAGERARRNSTPVLDTSARGSR